MISTVVPATDPEIITLIALTVVATEADKNVLVPEELDMDNTPQVKLPPPSDKIPVPLTVNGLEPLATVPPLLLNVPPDTTLVPPFKVIVLLPVLNIPKVWLKLPDTVTFPVAFKI